MRYGQAYPIDGATAVNVVKSLLKFITHHGVPHMIVSDSGTEFKNGLVKEFVDTHKILLIHYATPDNPSSNGMIERFHSTLIEHLRTLREKYKNSFDIQEHMPYAILAYNSSIHSTTKQKPIEILNGHLDTQDPFDVDVNRMLLNNYTEQHREKTKLLYEQLNQKAIQRKEKIIQSRNQIRDPPTNYEPSTKIFTKTTEKRNKLLPRFAPKTVKSNNKVTVTTVHKKNIKHIPKTKTNKQNLLQIDNDNMSRNKNPEPGGQSRDTSPKSGPSKGPNQPT